MHYKEVGMHTNTGKLIQSVLPSSRLLVHPLQELDLECTQRVPVVLWPGPDSRSVRELDLPASGRLTLIALDGTWKQVKSMARKYSSVQRVHVSEDLAAREKLLTPALRLQTRPLGASTAEAVAIALRTLGESGAAARLFEALALLNAHRESVLGSERVAQREEKRRVHWARARPSTCTTPSE